jgi:hypothetical protein
MARRADSSAHSRDKFNERGLGRQQAMAAGMTIIDDCMDDAAIDCPDVSREISAGRKERAAEGVKVIKGTYRMLVSWLLTISAEDSVSVSVKHGAARRTQVVRAADVDDIDDGTTAADILASVEQHEETEHNPEVRMLIESFRGLHRRKYEILVDLELDAHECFQGGLIDRA